MPVVKDFGSVRYVYSYLASMKSCQFMNIFFFPRGLPFHSFIFCYVIYEFILHSCCHALGFWITMMNECKLNFVGVATWLFATTPVRTTQIYHRKGISFCWSQSLFLRSQNVTEWRGSISIR